MCKQLVEDVWYRYQGRSFYEKLNECASVLSEWGKEITGSFKTRIREYKRKIKALKGRRDDYSVECIKENQKKLAESVITLDCLDGKIHLEATEAILVELNHCLPPSRVYSTGFTTRIMSKLIMYCRNHDVEFVKLADPVTLYDLIRDWIFPRLHDEKPTNMMILTSDCMIMEYLGEVIIADSKKIRKEVCQIISNIAARMEGQLLEWLRIPDRQQPKKCQDIEQTQMEQLQGIWTTEPGHQFLLVFLYVAPSKRACCSHGFIQYVVTCSNKSINIGGIRAVYPNLHICYSGISIEPHENNDISRAIN
ncbi:hypothetical protein POM88_028301 [Heracleum sosnowskyi]|uniref:Uncharacterized protein n=1 Tax=Heracleum sosnowskyi TaxID=360622 RepID=A0AAD8MQP9_9APIA|nr:hypothetical protein POM88_028301 [Heracleum sosnowskyi]